MDQENGIALIGDTLRPLRLLRPRKLSNSPRIIREIV